MRRHSLRAASSFSKCSRLWLETMASKLADAKGRADASACTKFIGWVGRSRSARTTLARVAVLGKLPSRLPMSRTRASGSRCSRISYTSEMSFGDPVGGALDVVRERAVGGPGRADARELAANVFDGRAGLQRTEKVECTGRGEQFNRKHAAGVADYLFQLESGGRAHADEILFIAASGDGAGGRGCREDAVLGNQSGGGDLHHHEAGFESGVISEERREVLIERGIDQAVDAALGDAAEGGQRNGQVIEVEGERLAVEVAAGNDFIANDEGVVGDRVQLDGETARGLGE